MKTPIQSKRLEKMRTQIDQIDRKILVLLSKRFTLAGKIGRLKKELKISVRQNHRWKSLVVDRVKFAQQIGVSSPFTKKLLNLIHQESIQIQKRSN